MVSVAKSNLEKQTVEWWLLGLMGRAREILIKVYRPTFIYKTNEFWKPKVQHGNYNQ
jgi:hypothetical protein